MRARFTSEFPKDQPVSIEVEMTFEEWRALKKALIKVETWPVSQFQSMIWNAVEKMERAHNAEWQVMPYGEATETKP